MALSLFVTVGGFLLGAWLARTLRLRLLNPVVVGVVIVLIYLWQAKLAYPDYAQHTQAITAWLGPAVVALALPLHERTPLLKQHARAMVVGVLVGGGLAIASGWLAGKYLHLPSDFAHALKSRSVTAPIAMALAERTGHAATLAGAVAILTGMTGATLGVSVLKLFRVTNPLARGLAVGVMSHGIGTARMLEESEEEGAAAALGMCLNGVASALLLPWLILWWGAHSK